MGGETITEPLDEVKRLHERITALRAALIAVTQYRPHPFILDAQLAKTAFVAGEALSMGDIPVALMAYRFRRLTPEGTGLANLERWFTGCRMVATVDNGLDVDNDEQGAPIEVCSGPPSGWSAIWPQIRHLG